VRPRHRHDEFLRFRSRLTRADRSVELHLHSRLNLVARWPRMTLSVSSPQAAARRRTVRMVDMSVPSKLTSYLPAGRPVRGRLSPPGTPWPSPCSGNPTY